MVKMQPSRKTTDTNLYVLKNDDDTESLREKKIFHEVERIWKIYDIDSNGTLDFDEMQQYIQKTAFKSLRLSDR